MLLNYFIFAFSRNILILIVSSDDRSIWSQTFFFCKLTASENIGFISYTIKWNKDQINMSMKPDKAFVSKIR